MVKIKSHKSVEQIAKKHRLDVSFIENQLKIGEPIEHEHTKDHNLAMDIALQHLDEIPDYYTRLKKMEASAKKEHRRSFKDIKEYYGCGDNAVGELEDQLKKLKDTSYDTIDKLMRHIMKKYDMTAKELHNTFIDKNGKTPDEWIKQKINEEGLTDWFKSTSKNKKPGWVDVVDGDACAREEGETATPKCVSSEKRTSMSKVERLAAQAAKRREDPNQPQKSGASKPTMVKTDRKTRTEEIDLQEVKDKPGKGSGKKDACYHKVKSRYDVWPSAYASGALVKCRNVGADKWGTKSEATMHEEERYCPLCDKRETKSQCSYGEKAWDKVSVKDEEYSMARSELKIIRSALKRLEQKVGKGEGDLEAWVQSKITKAADYIDTAADYVASGEMKEQRLVDKIIDEMKCWPGYKKKGTQKLFGKKYNTCVKTEDVSIQDANGNTFAEIIDIIKPEPIRGFKSQIEETTRMQSQTGNVVAVTLLWRGKYYSLKIFFPDVRLPSRTEINNELQKVYPGCRLVHHSVSEFTSGGPLIQTCGFQGGSSAKPGPSKNYVKTMGEEVGINEEGPSLSVSRGEKLPVSRGGGLTAKGREKYNRETGSNLQAPVTGDVKPGSKAAKRRKNFCSRSRSWKGERGLAARRRWKC